MNSDLVKLYKLEAVPYTHPNTICCVALKGGNIKIDYNDLNILFICAYFNNDVRSMFLHNFLGKYFDVYIININDPILSNINIDGFDVPYQLISNYKIHVDILARERRYKKNLQLFVPYYIYPVFGTDGKGGLIYGEINNKIKTENENHDLLKNFIGIVYLLRALLQGVPSIELFKLGISDTSQYFNDYLGKLFQNKYTDPNYFMIMPTLTAIYEYAIKNEYKILDSDGLKSSNCINIKAFMVSQQKFIKNYATEVKGQRHINKIKGYFYIPVPIEKDDIFEFFGEISPKSMLIDLSQVPANNIAETVSQKIYNFFNQNNNTQMVLIKYPKGSVGKGIYGIHRDNIATLSKYLPIYLSKLIEDIKYFIQSATKIITDMDALIELKKDGLIIQEYIQSTKCNLNPTGQTNEIELSQFYCFEENELKFDQKINNLLREKEVLNDMFLSNDISFDHYSKAIDFNGKLDYMIGNMMGNTRYGCFVELPYKLRIFPVFKFIRDTDNQLILSIEIPEFASFEWLVPFNEKDLTKFFKNIDGKYNFVSINRYVSNGLAAMDPEWANFSKQTSNPTNFNTHKCLRSIFAPGNNPRKLYDFMEKFLNGYINFIMKKHGGIINSFVSFSEDVREIIFYYSIDVLVNKSYEIKVIDINNKGVPLDSNISRFIVALFAEDQRLNDIRSEYNFSYRFLNKNQFFYTHETPYSYFFQKIYVDPNAPKHIDLMDIYGGKQFGNIGNTDHLQKYAKYKSKY